MHLPKREVIERITRAYDGVEQDKLQEVYNVIMNRPLTMQGGDETLDSLSKRTAEILKDPLGPKVAVFDLEGFDTHTCLLYTSPSPRDYAASRMPSSA